VNVLIPNSVNLMLRKQTNSQRIGKKALLRLVVYQVVVPGLLLVSPIIWRALREFHVKESN
jgi:hypothetical protein